MKMSEEVTGFKITDLIPAEAKVGLVGMGIILVGFLFWKKRRRKKSSN
jgi:hypothetical protein